MKLLIITQKVDKNDSVLGFFHRWILEFSKKVELVNVICLEKGEYDLPNNVHVHSLGKEKAKNKLLYVFNFYKYIWSLRKEYDVVFVHMNQIYVILGYLVWKIFGKKISLWYAHGQISTSLRFATFLSDILISSSKKGFRLETHKLKIVGQGIDVDLFKNISSEKENIILTTGRISNTKNIDTMVDVLNELGDYKLVVIGEPITIQDSVYMDTLKKKISSLNLTERIIFKGSVAQEDLPGQYKNAKVFLNLSDTGSLDKAVLEAMSLGLIVFSSNIAFKDILNEQFLESKNPTYIAEKIKGVHNESIGLSNREFVIKNHSLDKLIKNILSELK